MSDPRPGRKAARLVVFLAVTGGIASAAGLVFNLLVGRPVAALACLALLTVDVLAVWVAELADLVRRTDARWKADFDDLARAVMLVDHDAYDRIRERIRGSG